MPASSDDVLRLLSDVKLFQELSAEEREAVALLLEPLDLPAHASVVRQGDSGDAMYVLARGRLKVTVDDAAVDDLGPGAVVGEMALLTSPERNATVTATEEGATLWRLSRADFERLTADRPHILAAVHAVGRPRLQRAQLAPLVTQRFGADSDAEVAAMQLAEASGDVREAARSLAALRGDVRQQLARLDRALAAVERLAETLERDPASLLYGRAAPPSPLRSNK